MAVKRLYKSELQVTTNDYNSYTIPLYFDSKEASQVLCFLIAGCLSDYDFRINHYKFSEKHFVHIGKEFIVKNNKRRVNTTSKRIKYYSKYVVNGKFTDNEEVTLLFTFISKADLIALNLYLSRACSNSVISQSHYVHLESNWCAINLPEYEVSVIK